MSDFITNGELRIYAEELENENTSLHGRIAFLEDENDKLRELVRHLMACGRNKDCDTCPYREEPCDFDYDVRELGIEV